MAPSTVLSTVRFGTRTFLATHCALSVTSIAWGAFGPTEEGRSLEDEAAFDAHHYQMVTNLVGDMYSGKGVGTASSSSPLNHVELGESVTFEDPAVVCSGPKEVQEAFRALASVNPESLEPPRCIHLEPKGAAIGLTYALNQRYAGVLNVSSLLMVHVHLSPIRNNPESKFVVTKIQERWNGARPLGSLPFWIAQRINGIISWNLTSWLIRGRRK